MASYENKYCCTKCTNHWSLDDCDSFHDDKCEECNTAMTPYLSIESTSEGDVSHFHGDTKPTSTRKLTDDSKFKVFQKTSGHFLTECVPDNWNDLDDTESDDFLTGHLTSDLENHTASDVYSLIEDAASVTIELIESNTLTFIEEK